MVSRTLIRPAISGGYILGGGLGLTIAIQKKKHLSPGPSTLGCPRNLVNGQ